MSDDEDDRPKTTKRRKREAAVEAPSDDDAPTEASDAPPAPSVPQAGPPGYGPPQHYGPPGSYGGGPPHVYGSPGGRYMPPPKKSNAPVIAASVVGGLVLLGVIGAIGRANKTTSTSTATPTTATTAPARAVQTSEPRHTAAAPTSAPRQPQLGEEFRLGDFTYAVKKVSTSTSVGDGYAAKRASPGAVFVVVEYSIRNDGKSTATVLTDDFKIVDEQGREFAPSVEGNTAIVMSGDKDLALSQLQPGIAKVMQTAFELPEPATKGVFSLVIPEKGLFGSGSVKITFSGAKK